MFVCIGSVEAKWQRYPLFSDPPPFKPVHCIDSENVSQEPRLIFKDKEK